MPKPVVEQSTTLKAGKKGKKSKAKEDAPASAPHRHMMEPVPGGSVRVVEFEHGEEPKKDGEVHYHPKHAASMDHIHFEVDNLDRLSRGAAPRKAKSLGTRRVFETTKGGVQATDVETHRGTRRVLHTQRQRGSRIEETRFHSGLVDKIIAERYKDGPTFEAVDEEPSKPRFGLFKKKAEDDPDTKVRTKTTTTKSVTKGGKTTTSTKTSVSGWAPSTSQKATDKPAKADAATATFSDYKGDSHHVIEIEGIGTTYAKKLGSLGVRTTARLCYEDAAALAAKADIPQDKIEQWQTMAQLMKVNGIGPQMAEALARAGIDMDALKRRKPDAMAKQVKEYLDGLTSKIVSRAPGQKSFETWQAEAKTMRRVKQPVPVE